MQIEFRYIIIIINVASRYSWRNSVDNNYLCAASSGNSIGAAKLNVLSFTRVLNDA